MNFFLIQKYIQKLTKEDISKFATSQGINLDNNEIDIIYYYIKNRYPDFFSGKQLQLLKEIKEQVKPTTYNKIEELYQKYQNKY